MLQRKAAPNLGRQCSFRLAREHTDTTRTPNQAVGVSFVQTPTVVVVGKPKKLPVTTIAGLPLEGCPVA